MQVLKLGLRWTYLVCATWLIVACDPIVDRITPLSYVGLLISDTAPLRNEIGQSLSSNRSKAVPNAGLLRLNPRSDGIMVMPVDFGWVTSNGTIVVHNKKYGVVVIQEPTLSPSGVRWNCTVYPEEAKPTSCNK